MTLTKRSELSSMDVAKFIRTLPNGPRMNWKSAKSLVTSALVNEPSSTRASPSPPRRAGGGMSPYATCTMATASPFTWLREDEPT
jgi:hypothetical protein